MVNVIDINNRNKQIDINDANRQTDINNPNELTNVINIMNEQIDIGNRNGHISTYVDIKVCIYFRQNTINLNFHVTNKLQMFLKLKKFLNYLLRMLRYSSENYDNTSEFIKCHRYQQI